MFNSALVILFGWVSLVSVSASPAVEDAYGAVVGVVSPGQQHLTGDSLRTLFNTLENRVQCGDVPCGKVSFISPRPAVRARGRGPTRSYCFTFALN